MKTSSDQVQQVVSMQSDATEHMDKEDVRVTDDGVVVDHGLRRTLKQRHLQMIALGGVVGSATLWHETSMEG